MGGGWEGGDDETEREVSGTLTHSLWGDGGDLPREVSGSVGECQIAIAGWVAPIKMSSLTPLISLTLCPSICPFLFFGQEEAIQPPSRFPSRSAFPGTRREVPEHV